MKITVSHKGPKKSDFTKEELDLIDIDNLQETVYDIYFKKPFNQFVGVADLLKYETRIPLKYLKPIPNACSYVAQKAKGEVQIEPLNPDWVYGQIRFNPINHSIPIDTVFTISKEIPIDGEPQWVTSSDIKCTKNLKELILKENPDSKHFVLTNSKIDYFGQDIGSKLEGKFKVDWTDDRFDNLRLFRFKRPELEHLQFFIYDFMDIDLKFIMNRILTLSPSKECEQVVKEILSHL